MVLLMGVSGCGKTTVGKMLAEKIDCPFYDADNFHPKNNVLKMSNGIPLTDQDRLPWLETLATNISAWNKKGQAVLACSALKEAYREKLSKNNSIFWVYLKGNFETIFERMNTRGTHYMKPSMLKSQFEDLEPPSYGFHCDIANAPEEIVSTIIFKLEANGYI